MVNKESQELSVKEEFFTSLVPKRFRGSSKKLTTEEKENLAMQSFKKRISLHVASTGTQQGTQRAPGFDYVRWKPHGQHRVHLNPDEYVQTCQGLAPYVSAVAASSYEGLEERRWAGLTQAPPPVVGMPPRSGYTSAGSRSQLG